MTALDSRPARTVAIPSVEPPAGTDDALSGQLPVGTHSPGAAEGQDSRSAKAETTPKVVPPAGSDPLSGHTSPDLQTRRAAEGQDSPQATLPPLSKIRSPAGVNASHGHRTRDAHPADAVADHVPAGHSGCAPQGFVAGGDSEPGQPAATGIPVPSSCALPAAPSPSAAYTMLGFASAIFDDMEDAREAAEARLRQLTRDEDDADGLRRGLGLAADDPAVTALARIILTMKCDSAAVWALPGIGEALGYGKERKHRGCCPEHEAERNLLAVLASTPLGSFAAEHGAGIGERQLARLLGATGDPYLRRLADGSHEPRTLSQWRAYCGHGDPLRKPFKGMTQEDAFRLGNRAAKMRAHLIAEQTTKFKGEPDKNGRQSARSPYRDVYDAARDLYVTRVHAEECRNRSRISPNGCGTRDHPEWGEPGSPWRDGHQHGAALRMVAKCILDDLYDEAKQLTEAG